MFVLAGNKPHTDLANNSVTVRENVAEHHQQTLDSACESRVCDIGGLTVQIVTDSLNRTAR